jgi:hypothetical protein
MEVIKMTVGGIKQFSLNLDYQVYIELKTVALEKDVTMTELCREKVLEIIAEHKMSKSKA